MIVRGGTAGAEGLELAPGGETWIHTAGMTGEIRGRIFCPASAERLLRDVSSGATVEKKLETKCVADEDR